MPSLMRKTATGEENDSTVTIIENDKERQLPSNCSASERNEPEMLKEKVDEVKEGATVAVADEDEGVLSELLGAVDDEGTGNALVISKRLHGFPMSHFLTEKFEVRSRIDCFIMSELDGVMLQRCCVR